MKTGRFFLLAIMGIALGGSIVSFYKWRQDRQQNLPDAYGVYSHLPDFSLPNIDGSLWRAEEWRNKILVINFWATWCVPCVEEIDTLIELRKQFADRDLLFVSIAIDDEQAVREFIEARNIDLPVLLGETHAMELSRQLGDRFYSLPYTVVADRGGEILMRKAGGTGESELRSVLETATSVR